MVGYLQHRLHRKGGSIDESLKIGLQEIVNGTKV